MVRCPARVCVKSMAHCGAWHSGIRIINAFIMQIARANECVRVWILYMRAINGMFVVVVVGVCTGGALIAIRASHITHIFYGIASRLTQPTNIPIMIKMSSQVVGSQIYSIHKSHTHTHTLSAN